MKELTLSDSLNKTEIIEKVSRFIYNNQNSLPVSIICSNHKAVIIVLENHDFKFIIKDNRIVVTS